MGKQITRTDERNTWLYPIKSASSHSRVYRTATDRVNSNRWEQSFTRVDEKPTEVMKSLSPFAVFGHQKAVRSHAVMIHGATVDMVPVLALSFCCAITPIQTAVDAS